MCIWIWLGPYWQPIECKKTGRRTQTQFIHFKRLTLTLRIQNDSHFQPSQPFTLDYVSFQMCALLLLLLFLFLFCVRLLICLKVFLSDGGVDQQREVFQGHKSLPQGENYTHSLAHSRKERFTHVPTVPTYYSCFRKNLVSKFWGSFPETSSRICTLRLPEGHKINNTESMAHGPLLRCPLATQ